jgi:hypothetical protein
MRSSFVCVAIGVVGVLAACSAGPDPLGTFRDRADGPTADGGTPAPPATSSETGGPEGGNDGAGHGGDNGGTPPPPSPHGAPDSPDARAPPPAPSGDGGSSPLDAGAPGPDAAPTTDAGTPAGDPVLQHCVDKINSYRAQIGAPPYARSAPLESFAAQAAASDAQTGQVHGYFDQTNGGGGVAATEGELPGYSLQDNGGSIEGVVDSGLDQMWSEGPGGANYEEMASTQYTTAACGYATAQDQSIWVVFDFR